MRMGDGRGGQDDLGEVKEYEITGETWSRAEQNNMFGERVTGTK